MRHGDRVKVLNGPSALDADTHIKADTIWEFTTEDGAIYQIKRLNFASLTIENGTVAIINGIGQLKVEPLAPRTLSRPLHDHLVWRFEIVYSFGTRKGELRAFSAAERKATLSAA